MQSISKSKLMALRQCPKRLWLELHRPDLREDSDDAMGRFQTGYQVGEIARRLFDPADTGVLIDIEAEGITGAVRRSKESLRSTVPIFEAGFSAGGALAFADVMLPVNDLHDNAWHMIEIKSSTSVKDYHRDDVAVQAFAARMAGVSLASVSVAHIDSGWTYRGDGDYNGFLTLIDLTNEALAREPEVKAWIDDAGRIAEMTTEPEVKPGSQCGTPFLCGFHVYCSRNEPVPEQPVHCLPRFSSSKVRALEQSGIVELRDVPDKLLNEKQLLVKQHTLRNTVFFDALGAAEDLAMHALPVWFMDFETIQFAVPIWKETRPYQQIPFQFSVRGLAASGMLHHVDFLDLSGADPSEPFAKALIAACGSEGAVFVYNAGFERARVRELARRYSALSDALLAINERVVDLLPVARNRYYHPAQQGSWSIKAVLPAVVPALRYDALEGVQDGGMATNAFMEAIDQDTSAERHTQIDRQLREYCGLDTYAMVRLWQIFAGRHDLRL